MLEVSSYLLDEDDSTLSADSTHEEESTLTFENISEKAAYIANAPRSNSLVSQNIENNTVACKEGTLKKVEVQHNESYQGASSVKELSRKGRNKLPPFAVAFKTPFSYTVAFREYLRTPEVSRMVASDERGTKGKYVKHTKESITNEEKSLLTRENTSSTVDTEIETIRDSSREVREENWNENTTFINAQSAAHEAKWQWDLPKEDKLSTIICDFLDSTPKSKAETSAPFLRFLSEPEHGEGEFETIQCMESVASYRENCQADPDTVRKINLDQPKASENLCSSSLPHTESSLNQVSLSEGTVVDENKTQDCLVFKENFGSNSRNHRLIEIPMSEVHKRKQEVATPPTLINIAVQVNTKQQDQVTKVLTQVPGQLQTKNETRNRQKNKSMQVTKNQQQNQLYFKRQRRDNQRQKINKELESIIEQDRASSTSKQILNLETPKVKSIKKRQRTSIQRTSAVENRTNETMKLLMNILQQKLLR